VVDQQGLVAIALSAVRNGIANPNMWVELAKCVNLHPDYRLSLPQWLEKIDRFLEGGRSFKLEDYSAGNYPLLPSLWHAMEPNHKRLVFDVVGRNGD